MSGPFKMKGWSPFTKTSPVKQEVKIPKEAKLPEFKVKPTHVTPEMMKQLDDQIAEMKKLGKSGAAQVLIDKKSKLMDSMKK